MGGSQSKAPAPVIEAPQFDTSKAVVTLPTVAEFQEQANQAASQASQVLQETGDQLTQLTSKYNIQKYALWTLGILCAVFAGLALYYYVLPSVTNTINTAAPVRDLNIMSAVISSTSKDISTQLVNLISNQKLNVMADESIGMVRGDTLKVTFQYGGDNGTQVKNVNYGSQLLLGETVVASGEGNASTEASVTQITKIKDATIPQIIRGADAQQPASEYSYQFWMHITDFGYRYGEDKHVFVRHDPSNKAISNPMVSIHPTDNVLKVVISVYPSSNSSKTEPAPAGHSGSTEDVFICEIPNLPVQQWVAVGISVSTRNLDVYFNGKMVKSCFLTGLPKPAIGDITVNDGGGFSGWMCTFNHYPKSIQPADASSYYSTGAPCTIPGDEAPTATFGFFDVLGKVISKYVFIL